MGPMSSTDLEYDPDERQLLLEQARGSITYGIKTGDVLQVDPDHFPSHLTLIRASFVTLNLHGSLRGCIGTLTAIQPLIVDVTENAYNAAFRDPRFAPLNQSELDELDIHISVLSKSTPIQFDDEEDLIRQLRPGIDGLILSAAGHRGTFLPSVWESLPEPHQFLRHLKNKAGLASDYWNENVTVERYTTESIP